jgi:hypothetical protein
VTLFYRWQLPEDFKETVERMLRAGKNKSDIEQHYGYAKNSSWFDNHIAQTWPQCRNISDLRVLLGLHGNSRHPFQFNPELVKKYLAEEKRIQEMSAEIVERSRPIFAGHTCIQPVEFRAVVDNIWIGTWNTSEAGRQAKRDCPRCQTGDLLPGNRPGVIGSADKWKTDDETPS